MRLLLVVVTQAVLASAFTSPTFPFCRFKHQTTPLWSSTTDAEVETSVPIVVTGTNIDLTPALITYVNKKLEKPLGKLYNKGAVVDCEAHLSVNKNPKVKNAHRIEVTTNVKGTTLRTTEESPDMYASIDAVSDRLTNKLRRYKERRLDGYHGGKSMADDLSETLEELFPSAASEDEKVDEQFVDPEAPKVTKIKSFDLGTPISVEEAIFALDYVDHDFYVFREKETNDINVVYKRNAGGIGLIQPQK